jgi:hypothetical protein
MDSSEDEVVQTEVPKEAIEVPYPSSGEEEEENRERINRDRVISSITCCKYLA